MHISFDRAVWLALAVVFSWTVGAGPTFAEDDKSLQDKAAQETVEPGTEGDKKPALEKEDPFKIPEGGSAELLKFLEKVVQTRPTSRDEALERRKAFKAASEKIIKLEAKTPKSKAAATARGYLFQIRLAEFTGSKEEIAALINDLTKHFALKGDALDELDVYLATTTGRMIERGGDTKLATKALKSFAKAISAAKDPTIAAMAARLDGFVRRLNLLGNKMELEGTTVDGKKFDWASYRGKFVLVDFWATWCGPCIAEMPNVQRNYELYHKLGFEVVGISLDTDRRALERFLADRKVPWNTLYEENARGGNAMAERYGVQGIPTVILVDKEGKAVSLNARGAELGRLLEKYLGPADTEKKDEAKDKQLK